MCWVEFDLVLTIPFHAIIFSRSCCEIQDYYIHDANTFVKDVQKEFSSELRNIFMVDLQLISRSSARESNFHC